ANFRCLDFFHRSIVEFTEVKWPKTDTDKSVHLQSERFENLAHLTILAFADCQREPDIGTLLAIERRFDRSVMDAPERDAATQPVECLLPYAAERPHAVTPHPAGRRQFQYSRKAAIVGEQQQSLRIDVEPADTDQAWQAFWQCPADRIAPLWIGMGCHQPSWLVIEEKPRAFARSQRLAVDRDLIGWGDVERGRRNDGSVDRYPPGCDPGFGLAPGCESRACNHLGDALAGSVPGRLFGH